MLIKPRFEAFTLHIILLASLGTFIPARGLGWSRIWSGVTPSLCPQLVVDWGSGWHLRARALAPIWVLNRMWYALLGTKLSCAPIALLRNG